MQTTALLHVLDGDHAACNCLACDVLHAACMTAIECLLVAWATMRVALPVCSARYAVIHMTS